MKGWRKYKLSELAHIQMGISPISSSYNNYGIGLPFYQGVIDYGKKFTCPRIFCSTPLRIAEPYSVLFSVRAPVGEINITKEKCCIGRGNAALVMKNRNQEFLYYLLKYLKESYDKYSTGTVFSSINKEELYSLEVQIPSEITEQTHIAEIFSSLDDKIELNFKINETLEKIAQAIFKHWFIDFEFPNDDGKPYKTSGGALVESEFGDIPIDWEVKSFQDYLDVCKGLSYKGSGLAESGTPLFNLNSVIEGGGFKYTGIKYYSGDYKEKHKASPGDILVANTEQGHKYLLIGYPAIVPKIYGSEGIFSHHIFRVRSNYPKELSHQYLYYLLLSNYVREQVIACTNGTTVNMLAIDGLQRPRFILPPKTIMTKYSILISSIWAQMENNVAESNNLSQIRDLLIPQLMSGKIRVV